MPWMVLLRDHGRLPLAEVLAPAIHYAEHGHPMLAPPWPMPSRGWPIVFREGDGPDLGGAGLAAGVISRRRRASCSRNPDCVAMWTRLVAEGEAAGGQPRGADRGRTAGRMRRASWPRRSTTNLREPCVLDATCERSQGRVDRSRTWPGGKGSYEAPLAVDSRWLGRCGNAGAWTRAGAGAVAGAFRCWRATTCRRLDPNTGRRWSQPDHRGAEARLLPTGKAYHGDPALHAIPIRYAVCRMPTTRRGGRISSRDRQFSTLRPGAIEGLRRRSRPFSTVRRGGGKPPRKRGRGSGAGRATIGAPDQPKGDTVHIDVVDRWGNIGLGHALGRVAEVETRVFPGLGVPLNTRAQMSWLDEGLPTFACARRAAADDADAVDGA